MRIVHTSDWHLGHTLHGLPRDHEHRAFLDWLLDTLEAEEADALLVAGDLFETASPSARAQELWFGFVAALRARLPDLDVVVIAGNHDSPARLDAAAPLLGHLGVRVFGALRRTAGGPQPEAHVVPLRDRGGRVGAWVAAVPFLRPADLPPGPGEGTGDPLVEGVRAVYRRAVDAARARLEPGQALIAMGHGYLAGTRVSELSERKVLGGNQHALPPDIFPEEVAYAALGHLHLAQAVGRDGRVRYSGSPLPLSLAEDTYPHQVVLAEFRDGELAEVRPLRVPRTVDIVRVPPREPAPLPDVLDALRNLPGRDPAVEERFRPYLEVRVLLERPEPHLRRTVEEALEGRAPRLLKLTVAYAGGAGAPGPSVPERSLEDLGPEEVFRACYRERFGNEPPEDLLAAFHELVESVTRGEAAA